MYFRSHTLYYGTSCFVLRSGRTFDAEPQQLPHTTHIDWACLKHVQCCSTQEHAPLHHANHIHKPPAAAEQHTRTRAHIRHVPFVFKFVSSTLVGHTRTRVHKPEYWLTHACLESGRSCGNPTSGGSYTTLLGCVRVKTVDIMLGFEIPFRSFSFCWGIDLRTTRKSCRIVGPFWSAFLSAFWSKKRSKSSFNTRVLDRSGRSRNQRTCRARGWTQGYHKVVRK